MNLMRGRRWYDFDARLESVIFNWLLTCVRCVFYRMYTHQYFCSPPLHSNGTFILLSSIWSWIVWSITLKSITIEIVSINSHLFVTDASLWKCNVSTYAVLNKVQFWHQKVQKLSALIKFISKWSIEFENEWTKWVYSHCYFTDLDSKCFFKRVDAL